MCRVQREKTWYSGQRGCILSPCQGQNGNPGLQLVRDAIAALPEKQRAAVLMHKYEELDYAQIGEVLGCSVSAVKSLLFRAYEMLRSRLAHLAVEQQTTPC